MAADFITLASVILLFVITCFVSKIYFAVLNMQPPKEDEEAGVDVQPRVDRTAVIGMHIMRPYHTGVTDIMRLRVMEQRAHPGRAAMDMQLRAVPEQRPNVHQRIGNRPRPQEHDG